MSSNNQRAEEIAEIRSQIARQLDSKQHYENLSWQLIRLVLSIIGFLLTTASILASIIISRGFSILAIFEGAVDLEVSVSNLSQMEMFDEVYAGYIITILVFSIGLLFLIVVYDIFFKSLSYAFKIQRPSDIVTGPTISSSSVHSDIRNEYLQVIEDNRDVIRSTKENWNSCLNHLKRGSSSFGILLFIAPALIFKSPLYVIIATVFLGIAISSYISNRPMIEKLGDIPIRKYSDLSIFLTSIMVTISFIFHSWDLTTLSDFTLIITAYIFLPILVIAHTIESVLEKNVSNIDFIYRNFVTAFIIFLILATSGFASSISDYTPGDFIALLLVILGIIAASILTTMVSDETRKVVDHIYILIFGSRAYEVLIGEIKIESDIDF